MTELWWAGVTGNALVLPPRGPIPSQRPIPSVNLQWWLACVLRALSFQLLWAAVFFVLSFRRSPVGLLINPLYIIATLGGIYGATKLEWRAVAISLTALLFLICAFLLFVILNYVGDTTSAQSWVVLALFLPGLAVDLIIVIVCAPFVRRLYDAEKVRAGLHAARWLSPSVVAHLRARREPPSTSTLKA